MKPPTEKVSITPDKVTILTIKQITEQDDCAFSQYGNPFLRNHPESHGR